MSYQFKNYSADQFAGAVSGVQIENIAEEGVTIEYIDERTTYKAGLGGNGIMNKRTRRPVKMTIRFIPDAPEVHALLALDKANTLHQGASYYQQVGTTEKIALFGAMYQTINSRDRGVEDAANISMSEMVFNFVDSEEL